jgi:hypothetical protein
MTNSEGDVCSPYLFISYYIQAMLIFVLFTLGFYIRSLQNELVALKNIKTSHCAIQTDVEPPILVVIDPNHDIGLLN